MIVRASHVKLLKTKGYTHFIVCIFTEAQLFKTVIVLINCLTLSRQVFMTDALCYKCQSHPLILMRLAPSKKWSDQSLTGWTTGSGPDGMIQTIQALP